MKTHVLLLLLFLALAYGELSAKTVTYTVSSKTAVRADGEEPVGSYAEFSQSSTTGKNGQMTQGNSTLLTVYGVKNLQIRSLTLLMHSNKAAGAGSLKVSSGTDVLWEIQPAPFADEVWAGQYTTEWTPVTHTFTHPYTLTGNTLAVSVEAQVSSLYIYSYTIEYQKPPTEPYKVSFLTHTAITLPTLTETLPGSGILLPHLPFEDALWHFLGWSTLPLVEEQTQCPPVLSAGERYYPENHTVLHALYADVLPLEQKLEQDTCFESGSYLITDLRRNCMATSPVNADKRLYTAPIRLQQHDLYYYTEYSVPQSAVYYIDFNPADSTASITHSLSGKPVGYREKEHTLQTKDTVWRYSVLDNHTVHFTFAYAGTTYSLRAGKGTSLETLDSVWYRVDKVNTDGVENILFRVDDYLNPPIVHYTSYPYGYDALALAPCAPVSLTSAAIHNPQCLLLSFYNLQGNLLYQTSQSHISFYAHPLLTWQSGLYLLTTPTTAQLFHLF